MSYEMSSLEQSELQCRQRDAATVRKAALAVWHFLTAPNDPNADAIERAKLVCQIRDAHALRDAAYGLSHGDASRSMGGAARA